jgi:hypothetical protein
VSVGTKSLLFGVHQVIWHPLTVLLVWVHLYGRPSWKELVCILIHDWGYWGSPNMDGPEGEQHPRRSAGIAWTLFGDMEMWDLIIGHSRHLAKTEGRPISRLCWADKLSICYDPWWAYIPRAWLSGELREYRLVAAKAGFIPLETSHREWYRWIQARFREMALKQRPEPYVNRGALQRPTTKGLGQNGGVE